MELKKIIFQISHLKDSFVIIFDTDEWSIKSDVSDFSKRFSKLFTRGAFLENGLPAIMRYVHASSLIILIGNDGEVEFYKDRYGSELLSKTITTLAYDFYRVTKWFGVPDMPGDDIKWIIDENGKIVKECKHVQ